MMAYNHKRMECEKKKLEIKQLQDHKTWKLIQISQLQVTTEPSLQWIYAHLIMTVIIKCLASA